jgi:hypothetical protein
MVVPHLLSMLDETLAEHDMDHLEFEDGKPCSILCAIFDKMPWDKALIDLALPATFAPEHILSKLMDHASYQKCMDLVTKSPNALLFSDFPVQVLLTSSASPDDMDDLVIAALSA